MNVKVDGSGEINTGDGTELRNGVIVIFKLCELNSIQSQKGFSCGFPTRVQFN